MNYRDLKNLLESLEDRVFYHVTPSKNVPQIMQQGLLAQVGDRSEQLGEESGIYLFPDIDSAEDAVANWMGAEFDEDEALALLEVILPEGVEIEKSLEWEYVVRTDIPANNIRVITEDF